MKNFKRILVGAALTASLMIQNVYAASFQTTYDDYDFKGFLTFDDDLASATATYEDVSGNEHT